MPGLRADLAVLEDLKDIRVAAVYKDGVLTAKEGVCLGAGKENSRYPGSAVWEKRPVTWKLRSQAYLTPSIWMR